MAQTMLHSDREWRIRSIAFLGRGEFIA